GAALEIVRTGSRGLLWLEPMVEVATPLGRVAYGPVSAGDVPGLLDAGLLDGAPHALALGPTEDIAWLKGQQRLTFAKVGVISPLSLNDYRAQGGFIGLERARSIGPLATIEEIAVSGLRGRGGAGFPAGIKWRTVHEAQGPLKYVVCNADEGDSGTFADRMLMEGDPFLLIEGMAICGAAVGAERGVIYIRSEYPDAIRTMREAVAIARRAKALGPFDIDVRVGAGAYICGEETSLLESIEGKRGQVRAKPPLPAHRGLFGRPTIVHNVLTLAAAPTILARGGLAYAAFGMGRSRGTKPLQLAGDVKRGGLYETAFGMTLRELVYDIGGGTASGRPVRAVQVGGPLGAYFPDRLLDTPLDYEAMAQAGGMLGHGGIVVFGDDVDMAAQARFAFAFCAIESCGKCTPCRIGSTRGVETLDKIAAGREPEKNMALVQDLLTVMTDGSLCALGGLTPLPVASALKHFPEDFARAPARAAAQ
ncbi:MAG: formate dehydrogenase, partial [Hyphomicrobiales bacterium]|nr:formate dehydrogenase [Hyphomicrobiales bacterium]